MPVSRKKVEVKDPSQSKVSLDMLRNAEIVDETAVATPEESFDDSRPSLETLNSAEMVDETPLIETSTNQEPDGKIEPDIKVVDGISEDDVVEKFKKFGDGTLDKKMEEAVSLLETATNHVNQLTARNQEILSENSKLKAEIESVRRAHAESNSISNSKKSHELELENQIVQLKNKLSSLQKDYHALTELHKEAILKTPEKLIPKPVIEEKPIKIKKSNSWEPPTHNPYKSFSKKYRT